MIKLGGWYEVKTCFRFWLNLMKTNDRSTGVKTMIFWGRLNASHKSYN